MQGCHVFVLFEWFLYFLLTILIIFNILKPFKFGICNNKKISVYFLLRKNEKKTTLCTFFQNDILFVIS